MPAGKKNRPVTRLKNEELIDNRGSNFISDDKNIKMQEFGQLLMIEELPILCRSTSRLKVVPDCILDKFQKLI